ncbi:MAG: DUF1992 domain-containing protein [Burkholderiaceae bacterium]|nr:DUF1992 domain-containing protein [Burkholderiaceae bacterium]
MPTLDEQIAQRIREEELSGQMSQAPSYGKALQINDGFMETPEELRLGYKFLKEAGFVPPEVELMQEAAELREALRCDPPADKARELRAQLTALELRIAMRLERLAKG